MEVFQIINDWEEVWAFLIPLTVMLVYRTKDATMNPVILYVCSAVLLNSIANTIDIYNRQMPAFLKNNNLLYNLHSLARVLFFSWYIRKITPQQFSFIYKAILWVYIIFVLVDFLFFESPFFISSRLFAAESIVLLFLCLSFFLRSLQDENVIKWIGQPSFLVCTGIVLYEAITFFIFLFFYPIVNKDPEFGKLSLEIYRITLIVFCIFLALALYRSRKQEPARTH